MYSKEDKILILGSLFHDIGKFEQRCTGNPARKTHQFLGGKLVDDLKSEFKSVLENDEESFIRMDAVVRPEPAALLAPLQPAPLPEQSAPHGPAARRQQVVHPPAHARAEGLAAVPERAAAALP
jgi:hypothetical protein